MKLVLIEWVDSCGEGTRWRELDDIKKDRPVIIRSVGWLVAENQKSKTIVPHISDSEHGQGEMTIPDEAIKKIRELDEPEDLPP